MIPVQMWGLISDVYDSLMSPASMAVASDMSIVESSRWACTTQLAGQRVPRSTKSNTPREKVILVKLLLGSTGSGSARACAPREKVFGLRSRLVFRDTMQPGAGDEVERILVDVDAEIARMCAALTTVDGAPPAPAPAADPELPQHRTL